MCHFYYIYYMIVSDRYHDVTCDSITFSSKLCMCVLRYEYILHCCTMAMAMIAIVPVWLYGRLAASKCGGE